MSPILQTLITLTIRILLRLLLLRQMPLAIRSHAAHMRDVIFVVSRGVFLRVLLQDLDDFAAAVVRVGGSVLDGSVKMERETGVAGGPFVADCFA
jgi:hypothetical protein